MVEHSHHIPEWRMTRSGVTVRLDPPPALGEGSNVVDGFARRFSRGPTNMWISDPRVELPQELVLRFAKSMRFCAVEIIFDNLTESRHEAPWESGIRVVPFLVKSYELSYRVADGPDEGWHEIASETSNYHRCCRHRFEPLNGVAVRLRVLETHGDGESARVYRVRVVPAEG
jgi:hypothetical protein